MRFRHLQSPPASFIGGLIAACLVGVSSSAGAQSTPIPAAPIVGQWPEWTFLPKRQCHGRYDSADLERYMPRARVALWLPGTRSVALDSGRRCIAVTVDGIGDGRLAELVLRGVSAPRRSVLLLLARRERQG